jgi:corrinoid protein of di/trimethylamine methyltransferase
MTSTTLGNLKMAILEYEPESAARWAKEALEEGIDPNKVFEVLTDAIRHVGDGFNSGELWLPDLVAAADAMQAATPVLEEELKTRGMERESQGVVVIGTVFGDIHNIGKAMVSTLLTAGGFKVYDIGVNIKSEVFLEAVNKYKADILAMSALLTTTAPEQRKVISKLEEEGVREKIKIIVGGGAITPEFAHSIGADGYEPTAPGAVRLARTLIQK